MFYCACSYTTVSNVYELTALQIAQIAGYICFVIVMW